MLNDNDREQLRLLHEHDHTNEVLRRIIAEASIKLDKQQLNIPHETANQLPTTGHRPDGVVVKPAMKAIYLREATREFMRDVGRQYLMVVRNTRGDVAGDVRW